MAFALALKIEWSQVRGAGERWMGEVDAVEGGGTITAIYLTPLWQNILPALMLRHLS